MQGFFYFSYLWLGKEEKHRISKLSELPFEAGVKGFDEIAAGY